jgi:hypothetical protein
MVRGPTRLLSKSKTVTTMHSTLLLSSLLVVSAAFLTGKAHAQSGQPSSPQEPLGFLERFALSDQREQILAELIPNTNEFFYYSVLHSQNEARVQQARALLVEWIAKFGINNLTQRMETRQAILEFSSNPNAAAEFLQNQFRIETSHPAPKRNEAAELPSKLDPKLHIWKEILQNTVKQQGIDSIDDSVLADVLADVPDIDQLRKWFSRSHRIDSPKLIDRMVEELTTIHSQGFGWAPIHRELTLDQLQELQKRIPSLDQNSNFVLEVLRHLLPSDDESIQDPAVRKRQLDQAQAYVLSLPEVHNSLIASVLHQRLVFDLEQGTPDRDRFKRYLRLPYLRPFCASEFREAVRNATQVDPNAAFAIPYLIRPIGNDTPLIEKYLDIFFRTDDKVDDFANLLDRAYLQRFFAITKILHGLGDPKVYYAQLSPEDQKELAQRVEVRFAPTNPSTFKTDDSVALTLDLKNTPELLIRIYRLNARNILSKQQAAISTAIDLDGVVPNVQRNVTYPQKSDLRHRESIPLPELEGQGVWIVEVLAGGQRSRALVQKGQLASILEISDAGQLVRIVNAQGDDVPTATVLIGEREFQPEKDGWILIPFDQTTQLKNMLLVDGTFAVLEPFNHLGEAYELRADFLITPQSILSGNRSAVVVRTQLLAHNQPIPLENLRDIELHARSIDLDGVSNTQVFKNLKLDENQELTQEFNVPPRLAGIDWMLQAKISQMRTGTQKVLVATKETKVNEFARSSQIHDSYLNRMSDGYLLEVRGRNGEPIPRIALQLDLKLAGVNQSRSVRLATDAQGEIELGRLEGVQQISIRGAQMTPREFQMPRTQLDWPIAMHAAKGETLRLTAPVLADRLPGKSVGVEALERSPRRFSLYEQRANVVVKDWTSNIKPLSGLLEIEGLEPGNYFLIDHDHSTRCDIQITAGQRRDNWIVGKNRTLSKTPTQSLAIERVSIVEGKLQIDLLGADDATRLLVVASPFAHGESDHWLRRTQRNFAPTLRRESAPSFYVDSMKLDEEYQYVLARQQAQWMLGSTLAHPTILLNPWELTATRNESQQAQAGDAIAEKRAAPKSAAPAPSASDPAGLQAAVGNSRDYGFLAQGTKILANIPIGAQGRVVLDTQEFQGTTDISLVAITPGSSAQTRFALPWTPPRKLADRRLPQSFDPQKHFIQKDSVLSVQADQVTDLGDVGVTRIRIYNSISELIPMIDGLQEQPSQFRRFDFLKKWSSLSDAEKESKYSQFACHELHLFLHKHDPDFTKRVVIPHVMNKSPRQLVDDWILSQDMAQYLKPWRYQQLNTLERILLTKRFPEKRLGLLRLLDDEVKNQPIPMDVHSLQFKQALRTSSLELDGTTAEFFSDESRLMEIESLSLSDMPDNGVANSSLGLQRGATAGMPAAPGGMGGMGGMAGGGGGFGGGRALGEGKNANMARKANRTEERLRELAKDKSGADADRFGLQQGQRDTNWNMPTDGLDALARSKAQEGGENASEDFSYRGRRSLDRFAGKQIQMYEPLAQTRKWAESQFDQIKLENQDPTLVEPSPFWIDVLKNQDNLVSQNLHLVNKNANECLLALAFVDLPLEAKTGNLEIENGRWIYKSVGKGLIYSQGIVAIQKDNDAAKQAGDSKVLLSENIYLASDDTIAKPVNRQELVKGTSYRSRVVLTNPTGNPMDVQILMQIPQGAIPLQAGRNVAVQEFHLGPFSTTETSHVFYFPAAGEFQHYGSRASTSGKYLAHIESTPLKVLDAPLNVDDTSWEYIAQWGSNDQVLTALDKVNIAKTDLALIAWRMQDQAFWKQVLSKLDSIGLYDPTLWGYALRHRDDDRLKEFLEANQQIVKDVSPYFDTKFMHVDSESRLVYEHLDFRPIVVARSHRLGPQWKILNDGLSTQYRELLYLLSHQPKILPRQRLSLTYYQLIQNRTQEALANFQRVDRASLIGQSNTTEAQMQYDYFDAYFAMRTSQFDRAGAIAKKYESYPVPRWNEWFKTVGDQIRQRQAIQNGTLAFLDSDTAPPAEVPLESDAQRQLQDGRESALDQAAAKLPGLELSQRDGQWFIQHKNLKQIQIHYYFVDVELMFSRNPFLGKNQSRLAVIEPNSKRTLDVESKPNWEPLEWKIPEELKNRNMILEVVSGGIVRSAPIYSNSLSVNLSVPFGRLQVLGSNNKQPIEGAYVKVYAKHEDGSVRFYKDGYTDLRGVMDYASLSTEDWATVSKYAILVLHPEYGAWIQECEPPTR